MFPVMLEIVELVKNPYADLLILLEELNYI